MIALLETRRGERIHMRCQDEVPWELVREVMRRAPQWARQVDGLAGTGEPPRLGRRATAVSLSDAAACYYSLVYALQFVEAGSPVRNGPSEPVEGQEAALGVEARVPDRCPGPPRDSRILAEIVRLQLAGYSYQEIAARLRYLRRRKLRGGGQHWSRSSVGHALLRAYRCLLCPAGGGFLTDEEWSMSPARDGQKGGRT